MLWLGWLVVVAVVCGGGNFLVDLVFFKNRSKCRFIIFPLIYRSIARVGAPFEELGRSYIAAQVRVRVRVRVRFNDTGHR
jgi:hypothetical protein